MGPVWKLLPFSPLLLTKPCKTQYAGVGSEGPGHQWRVALSQLCLQSHTPKESFEFDRNRTTSENAPHNLLGSDPLVITTINSFSSFPLNISFFFCSIPYAWRCSCSGFSWERPSIWFQSIFQVSLHRARWPYSRVIIYNAAWHNAGGVYKPLIVFITLVRSDIPHRHKLLSRLHCWLAAPNRSFCQRCFRPRNTRTQLRLVATNTTITSLLLK